MTSEDWPEVRLGDLVSIKHGWPFKSQYFSEQLNGRPIVVNIGNFRYTGGFRFESTSIKEYRGEYPPEYELRPGEILLAMTCQTSGGEILGIPGRVPDDGRTYLHNQRIGRVIVDRSNVVDENYLYWLFLSPAFNRELATTASGSKILHTSPSRIGAFRFRLPPFADQKLIARTLDALQDKIELNRRLNRTLESITHAIFDSWFAGVDSMRRRVKGGKVVPSSDFENRGPTPIGDVAEVAYGAPFSSDGFNSHRRGRPLLRIRDLATHCPSIYTTEHDARETTVYPGDIVVGMDGEFRAHTWCGPRSLLNQRVCLIRARPGVPKVFLLEALREPLAFAERSKTGTTVIHLGKSDIDSFMLSPVTPELLASFGRATDPILDLIVAKAQESRLLERLRDYLVPRLLRGDPSVTQSGSTATSLDTIGPEKGYRQCS